MRRRSPSTAPTFAVYSADTLISSMEATRTGTVGAFLWQAAHVASFEGVYSAEWTSTLSGHGLALTDRFTFTVVRTRRGEV